MDLREIAAPSLSEDLTHGRAHLVEGALVLQIQKIKNVSVPSGKQHDPLPNKRLLRLLLTDGHSSIDALEVEGSLERLRYVVIMKYCSYMETLFPILPE